MRSLSDPLVLSNIVYGLATFDSWYNNKSRKIIFLQASCFIGSSLYHIFDEKNKYFYIIDLIPSNILFLLIINRIRIVMRYNKRLGIYSLIHLLSALYLFQTGGWPTCKGGCSKKYTLYHSLWHISGGLGCFVLNYNLS